MESNGNIHTLKDRLFAQIVGQNDVFYKSQQKDEADLSGDEKRNILSDLLEAKPSKFLERYHRYIGSEFLPLFESQVESDNVYLDKIAQEERNAKRNAQIEDRRVRNIRYLALQKLRDEGYFSNEKMREREPMLFDSMVGKYLEDHEKFNLRPTVDITLPDDTRLSAFTGLLSQFDESQRISDRGKECDEYASGSGDFTDRFMHHVDYRTVEADNASDFEMEFDSSDDEGREAEKIRREKYAKSKSAGKAEIKLEDQKTILDEDKEAAPEGNRAEASLKKFSSMKVSADARNRESEVKIRDEEESSGDEDETQATGIPKDQLRDEFISMMEERFLSGRDGSFFDYSTLENKESQEYDKMRQQDEEDAYFDAD